MASTLKINNLDTASGTTITIPTGKTLVGTDEGTIRTPGTVLQVKQATDETQRSCNTTSYAIFSNTLSVAVTPKAASSKFLVSFCSESYSSLNAISLYLTIFRDSTDIGNSSGYGLARHYINTSDASFGMNGVKLDSPNTTSQITYTVRAKLASGSGPAYFNSQTVGTLTVIEIAG